MTAVSKLTTPGYVYFIRALPDGPIKIGWSTNPALRLKAIQTGSPNPVALLHSTGGDSRLEEHLHRKFASFRMRGEWFQPVPEIIEEIDNLRSGKVEPITFTGADDLQPTRRHLRLPRKRKMSEPRLWKHENGYWYVLYGHRCRKRVSTSSRDKAEADRFMQGLLDGALQTAITT